MDITNSKKRGRPATGRAMDGTLFIRAPKEKVGALRGLVRDYLGSAREMGNLANPKAEVHPGAISGLPPSQKVVESKETASGLVSKSLDVIHELRTQNYQLACNEQRLAEEVASLKASLECARSGDSSESMQILNLRCIKAENRVRQLEAMLES